MKDDPPDEGHQHPCHGARGPEREDSKGLSRQPHPMGLGQFEGDLRPRVAHPDHEGIPFSELAGVAVVGGVQLDDPGVELGGEFGHPWLLPRRHGHHDVVGFETPVIGGRYELLSVPGQPLHLDSGLHRQVELLGIPFEVVGELVFGREVPAIAGVWQAGQPVEEVGGEEPKVIPPVPPSVAHPLICVDDEEGQAASAEVVPDRQASLSAPDDEGVHVLWSLVHVISCLAAPTLESTTGIV